VSLFNYFGFLSVLTLKEEEKELLSSFFFALFSFMSGEQGNIGILNAAL